MPGAAPPTRPAVDPAAEPAGDGTRPRRERVRRALGSGLLWLSVSALVAAVGLLRVDGVRPWRSLWAEDGTRFLMNAVDRPGITTWAQPYAGYRHLIPRMIGDAASRLPLMHAPMIFAVASTVLAVAALLLFAAGLRRWLPSAWMRAGLVLAIAVPHAMGGEVVANAANLHWYLTLGLIGLALLRPRRITTALLAAVVAFAFALSDPFAPAVAVLALIDAAWRTWAQRAPAREHVAGWPIALAMVIGGAIQVQTMLTHPRSSAQGPQLGWGESLAEYVGWVMRGGLSPKALGSVPDDTLLLAASGLAAVLAVAAAAARHRSRGNALIGVALIAASPMIFVVNVWVNHRLGERYAAVPVALLVAGILVLAAGVARVGAPVFAVLCVAFIGLGVASLPTTPQRSAGPNYVAEVKQAAASECKSMADMVVIPISPAQKDSSGKAQWRVSLPCSRLEHGQFEPRLP